MKFKLFFLLMCIMGNIFIYTQNNKIDISGKITGMYVFKTRTYLLNYKNVEIWMLNKDFNIVKSIKFKGEGPQELKSITNVQFTNNSIYFFSSNKFVEYTLDLKFQHQDKSTCPFILLSKNKKVHIKTIMDNGSKKHSVFLSSNKKKKNLTIIKEPSIPKNYFASATSQFIRLKSINKYKMFAVLNPVANTEILCFLNSGKLINKIRLKDEQHPVTDEYKKKFFKSIFKDPRFKDKNFRNMMKSKIYFPKFFPKIQDFYCTQDYIYIKTYKNKSGSSLFYRYKLNNNKLVHIWLVDKNIDLSNQSNFTAFSGNYYYYFYTDEKGDYYIYKKRITT